MRRDEIESLYAAGVDVVVGVIAAQAERIALLEGEIEELKRLIGRSSNNSSLPPSRDSPQARGQRSGKKRSSGKKQGGQPGREGRHRQLVADPDRVIEHWPAACEGCGGPLDQGQGCDGLRSLVRSRRSLFVSR
ncbi:MAG: DUF6444 domain-containing protein [Solirubrobacteraceae bacterium]